jgi:hypothetical protein
LNETRIPADRRGYEEQLNETWILEGWRGFEPGAGHAALHSRPRDLDAHPAHIARLQLHQARIHACLRNRVPARMWSLRVWPCEASFCGSDHQWVIPCYAKYSDLAAYCAGLKRIEPLLTRPPEVQPSYETTSTRRPVRCSGTSRLRQRSPCL